MIKRIENWFLNYKEKRRRKKILKIIKQAKQEYLNYSSPFMCFCFQKVEPSFFRNNIVRTIPEFKPSTFGVYVVNIRGCWWPMADRASRIKAFDKLIEIYSK